MSLTSITVSASDSSIGGYAFDCCTSLTGVCFQENAPSLGANVLFNANSATVYYGQGTAGWNGQMQTSGANFGVRTNRIGFATTGPSDLVK